MPNKFNTTTHNAMSTMRGEGKTAEIRLNLICPRATNKYRNDKKDFDSLVRSIKKDGLFSAITLNEINNFIRSEELEKLTDKEIEDKKESLIKIINAKESKKEEIKKANDELKYIEKILNAEKLFSDYEKEYLKEQRRNGRKYFVSDGNRRFYAYCSACVDKEIRTRKQMDSFYESYKSIEADQEDPINFNPENANRFMAIRAIVADDNFSDERERYNSANMNQRAINDIEIVDNTIDDMIFDGTWQKKISEIKEESINNADDRTIKTTIDKLKEKEIINDDGAKIKYFDLLCKTEEGKKTVDVLKHYKTLDEAKSALMKLPVTDLPNTSQKINNCIVDYLKNERGKEISPTSVNFVRNILDNYSRELIQQIYDGNFSFRNAKDMLGFYKYIPHDFKNQLPNIFEEVARINTAFKVKNDAEQVRHKNESDEFFKSIKNKISGDSYDKFTKIVYLKNNQIVYDYKIAKTIFSPKKEEGKKAIPFSQKDWVKLFKELRSGKKTIEEATQYLENLHVI